MTPRQFDGLLRASRARHAMSLIELLGVLAILSILAGVLLPALLKELDKAAADQEAADLETYGAALQRYIIRNHRIPSPNAGDWATSIAAELGLEPGSVTNNLRHLPRVFLVDSNGFGSLGLPYLQDNAGTTRPPNPRLMIVSSLGRTLPAGLVTGASSPAEFDTLWNAAPGSVPTTGLWAGWSGNPNDITVQRINLSPLFLNLWLGAYYSSWNCYYSIDTNSISPPLANWTNAYFLQSSVLNLYFTNANLPNGMTLDSQQILAQDSSFVFYGNEWRRHLGTNALSGPLGPNGGSIPTGSYDFAPIVNGFLAANPTSLTRSQQTNIVQSFIDYMNAYDAWAYAGFTDAHLYDSAVQSQAVMQGYLDGLVNAIQLIYQ